MREFVAGGVKDKIEEVPPALLVYYFVKLCFSLTEGGSRKILWANQYVSLVAVLNIFILLYVVEALTDPHATVEEKNAELAVYALL